MPSYKIRKDGLFSTGGSTPRFSKVGKTWNAIGPFNAHLTLVYSNRRLLNNKCIYDGAEVLVYEMVQREVMPVQVLMDERKQKKEKRDVAQQEKIAEYRRTQNLKEYARLKRELGLYSP